MRNNRTPDRLTQAARKRQTSNQSNPIQSPLLVVVTAADVVALYSGCSIAIKAEREQKPERQRRGC